MILRNYFSMPNCYAYLSVTIQMKIKSSFECIFKTKQCSKLQIVIETIIAIYVRVKKKMFYYKELAPKF